MSDEDYQVLLRIVQAEAGVCDEKGKILVADVIINRVLSESFLEGVKGVVYQGSQFQPVSNGRINSVKVTLKPFGVWTVHWTGKIIPTVRYIL